MTKKMPRPMMTHGAACGLRAWMRCRVIIGLANCLVVDSVIRGAAICDDPARWWQAFNGEGARQIATKCPGLESDRPALRCLEENDESATERSPSADCARTKETSAEDTTGGSRNSAAQVGTRAKGLLTTIGDEP